MNNYFFNFYNYKTQDGWTGREEQLKAAGYDESGVENIMGKGWSNDGDYPSEQALSKEGTFMSRYEQLKAVGLNIGNYELVYSEGYEQKPPIPVNVHYDATNATIKAADWNESYGVPSFIYLNEGINPPTIVAKGSYTKNGSGDYVGALANGVTIDTTKMYILVSESVENYLVTWIQDTDNNSGDK